MNLPKWSDLVVRIAFMGLGSGVSWTLVDVIGAQLPVFVATSQHGLALPAQFQMAGQVVSCVVLPCFYFYKHMFGNFSRRGYTIFIWTILFTQIFICLSLIFTWSITLRDVMVPLLMSFCIAMACGLLFDCMLVPFVSTNYESTLTSYLIIGCNFGSLFCGVLALIQKPSENVPVLFSSSIFFIICVVYLLSGIPAYAYISINKAGEVHKNSEHGGRNIRKPRISSLDQVALATETGATHGSLDGFTVSLLHIPMDAEDPDDYEGFEMTGLSSNGDEAPLIPADHVRDIDSPRLQARAPVTSRSPFTIALQEKHLLLKLWPVLLPLPILAWGFGPSIVSYAAAATSGNCNASDPTTTQVLRYCVAVSYIVLPLGGVATLVLPCRSLVIFAAISIFISLAFTVEALAAARMFLPFWRTTLGKVLIIGIHSSSRFLYVYVTTNAYQVIAERVKVLDVRDAVAQCTGLYLMTCVAVSSLAAFMLVHMEIISCHE